MLFGKDRREHQGQNSQPHPQAVAGVTFVGSASPVDPTTTSTPTPTNDQG